MGKHSKPEEQFKPGDPYPPACPEHVDGIHYYAPTSIDEGTCRCGKRIRQNNSGH